MTLLQRLTRRQENRDFVSGFDYAMTDWVAVPPHGMGTMHAGMQVNETSAMTIDVVHTALHVITAGIGKRGNMRAYTETIGPAGTPFKRWQSSPNQFLETTFAFPGPSSNSQFRGRMQSVVSLALFGEAWWYILTRDNLGNAKSVQVLHPLLLHEKKNVEGETIGWTYGGQHQVDVDPDNLYHLERISLPQHNRAISNIKESAVTYGIALAANAYTALWFSQGATPGMIITADQDVSETVAQRLSERVRTEHSGVRKSHLPFITGQNIKVQQTGASAEDAQMINTLDYVRTAIASMFGVPDFLIGGSTTKANEWGKTHEEVAQMMEEVTYGPYVTVLEEAHSDLLPRTLKAAWPETLVQPTILNLGTAIQYIRQAQVATPNEIRAMYFGLPPLPDGDDLIVPLASNVSPSQTNPADAPANEQEQDGADDGDDNS